MERKPTYEELEQRVKELENLAVTYDQAKISLKKSLEKQRNDLSWIPTDSEMAVDVLDQDIHERKPVEQALITEHIFRKSIEEAIPCGISGFDLEGRQIYVNRIFCKMVGWSEEELLGAKFSFLYWPQDKGEISYKKIKNIISGNISQEGIEMPFFRKNGDRFWGLVLNAPLVDREGEKIGQLMSVADITTQKRAENILRSLSARIIDAQETERRHVSQDLHDSIGGKLTGIKYSLEKILYDIRGTSPSLQSSLEEIITFVQNTIEETQRITRNLHPSILDDLGLTSAIHAYCREYCEIYSNIRIHSNIEIEENSIPDSLKLIIYRVFQEALNNIAKHSGADCIYLTLQKDKDRIRLKIQDNGCGFDLSEVIDKGDLVGGIGLQSMKERTEFFGGTLIIESKRGKGSVVIASWPYK